MDLEQHQIVTIANVNVTVINGKTVEVAPSAIVEVRIIPELNFATFLDVLRRLAEMCNNLNIEKIQFSQDVERSFILMKLAKHLKGGSVTDRTEDQTAEMVIILEVDTLAMVEDTLAMVEDTLAMVGDRLIMEDTLAMDIPIITDLTTLIITARTTLIIIARTTLIMIGGIIRKKSRVATEQRNLLKKRLMRIPPSPLATHKSRYCNV